MRRPRKVLAVLQARVASSRLPAKDLLPLAGRPAAVLSAQRAVNRGVPLCAVVSRDSSDDVLVHMFKAAGICVIRGPSDDVRRRFLMATRDLSDADWVIRLTADNVFPDGDLLNGLLDQFGRGRAPYLATGTPWDGVPYGLSAEVMTVGALRRAASVADDPANREHVSGRAALFRRGCSPTGRPCGVRWITWRTMSGFSKSSRASVSRLRFHGLNYAGDCGPYRIRPITLSRHGPSIVGP